MPEGRALHHPEPVLLVHDYQGQVLELHLLLDESVGTDHYVYSPLTYQLLQVSLGLATHSANEEAHPDGAVQQGLEDLHRLVAPGDFGLATQEVAYGAEVLLGQDLGRHHDGPLISAGNRLEQGPRSHYRLPAAHVPFEEPGHGHGAL